MQIYIYISDVYMYTCMHVCMYACMYLQNVDVGMGKSRLKSALVDIL